jgi:Protein of unknown function (DUF3168)
VKSPPLPDVTKIVSTYLRSRAEVAALVGNRVYSVFPAQLDPALTFALVQRVGGFPPLSRPLVIDLAGMQLDAYGGTQAAAHELVATCRAALAELEGEQPDGTGNVCGVVFGALRWLPDETFKPPKPRYVSDFEVTVKPADVAFVGIP